MKNYKHSIYLGINGTGFWLWVVGFRFYKLTSLLMYIY